MGYEVGEILLQRLDLDILPQRYRPRRLSIRQTLLGLLVGVALVLPLPMYRIVEGNAHPDPPPADGSEARPGRG